MNTYITLHEQKKERIIRWKPFVSIRDSEINCSAVNTSRNNLLYASSWKVLKKKNRIKNKRNHVHNATLASWKYVLTGWLVVTAATSNCMNWTSTAEYIRICTCFGFYLHFQHLHLFCTTNFTNEIEKNVWIDTYQMLAVIFTTTPSEKKKLRFQFFYMQEIRNRQQPHRVELAG